MTKQSLLLAGLLLASASLSEAADHLPINAVEKSATHGRYITTFVQATDGEKPKVQGTIRVRNTVALRGWRGRALIALKDEKGNIIYRHYTPRVWVNANFFSGHDRTDTFCFEIPDATRDQVRSIEITNVNADDKDSTKVIKQQLKKLAKLKNFVGA